MSLDEIMCFREKVYTWMVWLTRRVPLELRKEKQMNNVNGRMNPYFYCKDRTNSVMACEMTYGEFYKYLSAEESKNKDIDDDTKGYLIDEKESFPKSFKHPNHVNEIYWMRKNEFEYIYVKTNHKNITPYGDGIKLRKLTLENTDEPLLVCFMSYSEYCRYLDIEYVFDNKVEHIDNRYGYLVFNVYGPITVGNLDGLSFDIKKDSKWIPVEQVGNDTVLNKETFLFVRNEKNPDIITYHKEEDEVKIKPVHKEKTEMKPIVEERIIQDDPGEEEHDACGVNFAKGRYYHYYPEEKSVSFTTMSNENVTVSLPGETENISQLMLLDMIEKVQIRHSSINGYLSDNDKEISSLLEKLKEKLLIQEGESLTGIVLK